MISHRDTEAQRFLLFFLCVSALQRPKGLGYSLVEMLRGTRLAFSAGENAPQHDTLSLPFIDVIQLYYA